MNLQEYSESVVNRTSAGNNSDGVGVIDIAFIIGIVLPILTNLPCFKPKSPEEKREWIEQHPDLAASTVTREIRRQARGKGEKVARKHAKEMAETVIDDYLSSTDETINSVVAI